MHGVTLNTLLSAAVSGDPYNSARLGRETQRYAEKISRARAPDLTEEDHEDIAQQAFLTFWEKRGSPHEGKTYKQVFRACVLAAIRTVRAQNVPPGQRTRKVKNAPPSRVAAEDVGRIPDTVETEAALKGFGDAKAFDFDSVASVEAQRAILAAEHRIDIATILSKAPPPVADALRLVHLDDEPVAEVAKSLAISRFALNRKITAFVADWRIAA